MVIENEAEERVRVKPVLLGVLAWFGTDALFGIIAAVMLISRGATDPQMPATYQAEPFFVSYTLITGIVAIWIGGLVAARCGATCPLTYAGMLGGAVLLLLAVLRLAGLENPSILRMALAIPLALLGGFPIWLRRDNSIKPIRKEER